MTAPRRSPLSLTPVEAPQLCCGLLSWSFARVSLRLCLKLHQRPSRPLESRQGRMALNPVAQALPAGVLWHQGFAFKQCLRFRSIVVDRNCKAAEPPSAPAPCRSGVRGRSAIYASHFRDAIYLNQAEAETLFRVCSANFNLTLFQFFSTNLRENSAGSSALINRK